MDGEEEVSFDGEVLSISVPVRGSDGAGGEDDDDKLDSKIEGLLGEVLGGAFAGDGGGDGGDGATAPRVKVVVDREGDRIVIKAEEATEDSSTSPSFATTASGGRGSPTVTAAARPPRPTRPGPFGKRPLPPVTRPNDPSSRPQQTPPSREDLFPNLPPSFPRPTVIGGGREDEEDRLNGVTIDFGPTQSTTTDEDFVRFELEDAITPSAGSTTPQRGGGGGSAGSSRPTVSLRPSVTGGGGGGGSFGRRPAPPSLDTEEVPPQNDGNGNSVVEDEDEDALDSYLNSVLFGGGRGSSANIVQATVVEDFDFARRIRDQKVKCDCLNCCLRAILNFALCFCRSARPAASALLPSCPPPSASWPSWCSPSWC